MSRWWLLLVALLALLSSCVVSPTPWPIPNTDSGTMADSATNPTPDGAAVHDTGMPPDMGLWPDFAMPDTMLPADGAGIDRMVGDGMPGDGMPGDWMPGDWMPGDGTTGDVTPAR